MHNIKVILTNANSFQDQMNQKALVGLSLPYDNSQANEELYAHVTKVRKHESLLELLEVAFLLKDISYCSHVHFLTHRHVSRITKSQRFTKSFTFVIPNNLSGEALEDFKLAMNMNIHNAERLLDHYSINNSIMRRAMPQGVRVNMFMVFNVRELLHILSLRDAIEAEEETRHIAGLMRNIAEHHPILKKLL